MLFPTPEFAVFFILVLATSWTLMSRQKLWKPFVLAASYLFYAGADPRFCLLLAGVTLGNQAAAVLVHRSRSERVRRWLVAGAVALDLVVLGFFKYYSFFAANVDSLLGRFGIDAPVPLLAVALPIGVSFFTFQAISYVVDVRRGLLAPARTIDFALYLSFFPHLVAGPIVRAREFLPQLRSPRDPRRVAVGSGLVLIGLGLVKKVAIADYLARTIVDPAFGVPEAYGGLDLLVAAYAYSVQIYCDFSGYTDVAIGLALLMGFVFPQNFDAPYRARTLQEFWRRWHMTLSRFLRDFLYIPLGGSHFGRRRLYIAIMVTMLLGGLWHGAAWTFVAWGTVHGIVQCIEHTFRGRFRIPALVQWFVTFHIVVFGWILFRAQSIDLAGIFMKRLVTQPLASVELVTLPVALVVAVVIGAQLLPKGRLERFQVRLERTHPLLLATVLGVVIAIVAALVPPGAIPPFIYFQF